MIIKVAKHGHSFKGAAAYYLHDKTETNTFNRHSGNAQTSERVEFTETRNLATNNPDTAWKVMAATAMDSEYVKQQNREAEGKRSQASGKTDAASVYSFSIAWHPDEQGKISPEEMTTAAEDALERLGLSDNQALLVAHNDTDHPHIHVIVNKTNPETGQTTKLWNDYKTLDKFCAQYREQRNEQHYCPDRAKKWLNHAEGIDNKNREKQTGAKLDAGESETMNSSDAAAQKVRADQARFGARLSDIGERMETRHQNERDKLAELNKWEKIKIYAAFKPQLDEAKERAKTTREAKAKTYQDTEPKLSQARDKLAQAAFKKSAIYDKFKNIHAREYESISAKYRAERSHAGKAMFATKKRWERNEKTLSGVVSNSVHGARMLRQAGEGRGFVKDVAALMGSKYKRASAVVALERTAFDSIAQRQKAEQKDTRARVNQVRKSELAPSQKEYKEARAEISEIYAERKASRETHNEARADLDAIFAQREPELAAQKLNAQTATTDLFAAQGNDQKRLKAAWGNLKKRRTNALKGVKAKIAEKLDQRAAHEKSLKSRFKEEATQEEKRKPRKRNRGAARAAKKAKGRTQKYDNP